MHACSINTCPIYKRRTEVPYRGNLHADLIFCGESPGRTEERNGQAFTGPAGQLLWKACRDASLRVKNAFIMNAARCLLEKDKLSTTQLRDTLISCRGKVETALHSIKPRCIVALGDIALKQILKKSGIRKHRGRWYFSDEFDCLVLPTYHPAYCLRNPSFTPTLVNDLRKVVLVAENDWRQPEAEGDYRIGTLEDLSLLLENPPSVLAVDTETQGMDWLNSHGGMLGFSVSTASGTGLYFPLWRHKETGKRTFITTQQEGRKKIEKHIQAAPMKGQKEILQALAQILAHKRIKKYMMHGVYDLNFIHATFQAAGIPYAVNAYAMDVQVAAHVLDENTFRMASLTDLQFALTDMPDAYEQEFEEQFSKADMVSVPNHMMGKYAAADADSTLRVGTTIKKVLTEPDNKRLLNYFVHCAQPLAGTVIPLLEWTGTRINLEALPDVTKEVKTLRDKLHTQAILLLPPAIQKEHEGKLKLSRHDLLKDALFIEEGWAISWESVRKTKSGAPSTDDATRRELLERKIPGPARRFLEIYDEWSELNTLVTRYLAGFEKHVRADGRIHSSYSICTAATGRSASRSPNMQNVPKRSKVASTIRRLIIAEPGYTLLAIDAGQSELRVAAHVSMDPEMIKVFREGRDIHTATAESLAGKSAKDMQPKELKKARQSAKPCNFGLLYLMSAPGFAAYAKKDYGVTLSLPEATQWIRTWFTKYKRIQDYHQRTIKHCRQFGWVESPLGRRRRLPEILSKDPGIANYASRQAVNHCIQSASSDMALLSALTLIEDGIIDDDCRFVNFIHDELVFEIRDTDRNIKKKYAQIKRAMEHPPLDRFGVTLAVPLEADGKLGPNLADMVPM